MADDRTLLVVDDEEVVCQACRRIFSRQGFQVDSNTDARQGLSLATREGLHDHPVGHQDAQHRRHRVPGTAAGKEARRAGADHHRLSQHSQCGRGHAAGGLRLRDQTLHLGGDHLGRAAGAEHAAASRRRPPGPAAKTEPAGAEADGETLFWDESWVRLAVGRIGERGGRAPGAPRGDGERGPPAADRRGGLPGSAAGRRRRAEQAAAGRPVAGLRRCAGGERAVAPASPGWLATRSLRRRAGSPASARRGTRRLATASARRILLVNADAASAAEQAQKLTLAGCQVQQVADRDGAAGRAGGRRATAWSSWMPRRWARPARTLVGTDQPPGPAACGSWSWRRPAARERPPTASTRSSTTPSSRSPTTRSPTSWRRLPDAGGPAGQGRTAKGPSEPISSISITNRNLHKVDCWPRRGCCGATKVWAARSARSCWRRCSRGGHARRSLPHSGQHPQDGRGLRPGHGAAGPGQRAVARQPGPRHEARFDVDPGEAAGKWRPWTVQPDALGGFACLDRPDHFRPGRPYRVGHGLVLSILAVPKTLS